MKQYQSWGRYPTVEAKNVRPVFWRDEISIPANPQAPMLPYACGRSYGDSCLNEGGILLDVKGLKRFLAFDEYSGLLRCEAGVTLAEILEVFVPRGWFLPVTPGTKYVSVGGAIANDIHGKNHHKAGTFGCHVTQFELLRSNGERLVCSPMENSEMFEATIGGLGLTGIILWAEFRLKKIQNAFIDVEHIRFENLDEFFEITAESDKDFEYTVSWVDCIASGKNMGRGIFMRGNHNQSKYLPAKAMNKTLATAPFDTPSWVLNGLTMRAFNTVYYHKQFKKRHHAVISYDPFFYPLDIVNDWNRLYGKRGFLQYQFVVPFNDNHTVIKEMFERITRSGEGSFLAVLKTFGDVKSPGMLSFPKPGVTLALDFAFHGQKTLKLLENLDHLVNEAGGAIYPAKDARMSAANFQHYYPQWKEFAKYVDPNFSSSFWRRVTAPVEGD